ncbi:MAG: hypothetical protein WCZ23_12990 [Rhodospirillaceae bacterium]
MLTSTHGLRAAAVAVASLVALGAMVPLASAEDGAKETSVTVHANAEWQKTGVSVQQPCNVEYISGLWTASPQSGMYNSAGNRSQIAKYKYPLPGAPEGSLIGRIGNAIFIVGTGITTPPGRVGELEFVINDDIQGYYGVGLKDNYGAVTVSVSCQN